MTWFSTKAGFLTFGCAYALLGYIAQAGVTVLAHQKAPEGAGKTQQLRVTVSES